MACPRFLKKKRAPRWKVLKAGDFSCTCLLCSGRKMQVQTSVGQVCFCCLCNCMKFLWWHCDLYQESNPLVYWGLYAFVYFKATSQQYLSSLTGGQDLMVIKNNLTRGTRKCAVFGAVSIFSCMQNANKQSSCAFDVKKCAENWGKIPSKPFSESARGGRRDPGHWQRLSYRNGPAQGLDRCGISKGFANRCTFVVSRWTDSRVTMGQVGWRIPRVHRLCWFSWLRLEVYILRGREVWECACAVWTQRSLQWKNNILGFLEHKELKLLC